MGLRPHYLMDVLIGLVCVITLYTYWFWSARIPGRQRAWVRLVILVTALVVGSGALMSPVRISIRFHNLFVQWVKCAGIILSVWTLYSIPIITVLRFGTPHRPDRRRLLRTAATAAIAVPPLVATAAFLKREELVFREVNVLIPGLPKDLHGLRLAQLSDIHLSPFVSESLLVRAIDMANETNPHIALVTGDLVSRSGDPLDLCLDRLTKLRSDAGVFGCLGNHEIYAGAEEYTTARGSRLGMNFLRTQSQILHFGDAKLNLAGVDYQRRGKKYLDGAERLLSPGATNLLLSHNPDVFPVAAKQGFDLTIAGHTHGGQVNFEILERDVNIARFFTPYVYGLYERSGRSLFVTRGIGTVGAPFRLGAPPEVVLIRLCAS